MDPDPAIVDRSDPDLDAIAADLAGVETALARLADGSYRADETTAEALADELPDDRPTPRPPLDPT